MAKRKVFLSYEQMREIARFDSTFPILIDENELIEEVDFVCTDTYTYSSEDIFRAVKNILKKDPFLYEFQQDWLYPITELSNEFNLDSVYTRKLEAPIFWQFLKYSSNLNITDDSILSLFWSLFVFDEGISDSLHIGRILADKQPFEGFQRLLEIRNKPIEKWNLSDSEKLKYLSFFREKEVVQNAGERKIALANLCINTLYEKEVLLTSYEPEHLIIMGDIYYYGLNDHAPNYDKAFQYYRNAAIGLDPMGLYKTVDMNLAGYGLPVDADSLLQLYLKTYQQTSRLFLKGERSCFAQAALRCGKLYMKDDPKKAYTYYLQAQYAARLSLNESVFFGGTPIDIQIGKAIEEIRPLLKNENIHQVSITQSLPYYFLDLCKNNYPCEMTISFNEDDSIRLTSKRKSTRSVSNPEAILITIPDGSFCQRSLSVSYTADRLARIWVKEDALYFLYDFCKWDATKDRCSFYWDNELVATVDAEGFDLECKNQIMEYWIASISFSNDERVYDYICPFDVEPGDTVIVETFEGETEVTVVDIQLQKEDELPIPITKYKTIIEKY